MYSRQNGAGADVTLLHTSSGRCRTAGPIWRAIRKARKDEAPTFYRPLADFGPFPVNRIYDKAEWRAAIDLAQEPDFSVGGLKVSPSLCEIRAEAKTEAVEPRVMQVFVALAQAKGSVLSRDELVQRCWGGRIVSEDAINRCIAKVRKLAELDGGGSFAIETVPRVGYRLVESVPIPVPRDSSFAEQTQHEGPSATRVDRGWGRLPIVGAASAFLLVSLAAASWLFLGGGHTLPARPSTLLAGKPAAGNGSAALATTASFPPGTVFRDCPDICPQMVAVPAGTFRMGSPAEDAERHGDEIPQHTVAIRRAFAISKYPVTRAEYARFASETGRTDDDSSCFTLTKDGRFIETPKAGWRETGFPQTSQDPVVCMSWDDADSYANWLSRRTGRPYRLPSESEWEYAARAGAGAAHPGPASQICRLLNGGDADYHAKFPGDPKFDGACRDGYAYTSPVGSFQANAFGLFDMTGNVGQWVADCYNTTYDSAPTDGSAWTSGNCAMRVTRGGAWTDRSQGIRFARRLMDSGVGRFSSVGIRVARAL